MSVLLSVCLCVSSSPHSPYFIPIACLRLGPANMQRGSVWRRHLSKLSYLGSSSLVDRAVPLNSFHPVADGKGPRKMPEEIEVMYKCIFERRVRVIMKDHAPVLYVTGIWHADSIA